MACTKQKLLEICRTFEGVTTGSDGHKFIVDYYNKIQPLPRGYKLSYTDPWCAAFITVMADIAGGKDIFPAECSAQYLFNKIHGVRVKAEDLTEGDIIIYNWNGNKSWADHIGIVSSKHTSGRLIVLEGNKDKKVTYRKILYDSPYIIGCIRPHYEKETKNLTDVALQVIRGYYGNGDARKTALLSAGYDYDAVQKEVNRLLSKA